MSPHPPLNASLLWVILFANLALTSLSLLGGTLTTSAPLARAGAVGILLAACGGVILTLVRPLPRFLRPSQPPPAVSPPAESDPLPAPAESNLLPAVSDGLEADDCMRYADEAATDKRWARALYWTRRAKALTPPNARILLDEGEYLFQIGLFEEALEAIQAADGLETDGYSSYRGAQAAAAAQRPIDEVLAWIARALEKTPSLVGDLDLFRDFDELRGIPAYDALIAQAYQRLNIDPNNPGGPR